MQSVAEIIIQMFFFFLSLILKDTTDSLANRKGRNGVDTCSLPERVFIV